MADDGFKEQVQARGDSCCSAEITGQNVSDENGGHSAHGADAGHHHANSQGSSTGLISSAKATMHCLTGCTIGEVLGLLIGVSAGLHPLYTIMLAVFLAFAIGFAMAIRSVQASEGLGFVPALKAIWLGEVISMGIMELVMNVVDYSVGGMQSGSIFTGVFWLGIALAIPAGFLAAWPVNYWLLSKQIKNCCH